METEFVPSYGFSDNRCVRVSWLISIFHWFLFFFLFLRSPLLRFHIRPYFMLNPKRPFNSAILSFILDVLRGVAHAKFVRVGFQLLGCWNVEKILESKSFEFRVLQYLHIWAVILGLLFYFLWWSSLPGAEYLRVIIECRSHY